jgi:hypothetical protein
LNKAKKKIETTGKDFNRRKLGSPGVQGRPRVIKRNPMAPKGTQEPRII